MIPCDERAIGMINNRNAGLTGLVLAAALLLASCGKATDEPQTVEDPAAAIAAALASENAPTYGDPNAKVHIVEFMDPACETCALFYPMVKAWMSQVPGEIRLSVRHVAFHTGAEHAVKVLEASRQQGKYWETLEALLASQGEWTQHHTVLPEKIAPAIASVGLDMEKLEADMNSMEALVRVEQDRKDAILLRISKTPTYFVNGRPLPSFGAQQLADLIGEELQKHGVMPQRQ